jgi:hypothetical protein
LTGNHSFSGVSDLHPIRDKSSGCTLELSSRTAGYSSAKAFDSPMWGSGAGGRSRRQGQEAGAGGRSRRQEHEKHFPFVISHLTSLIHLIRGSTWAPGFEKREFRPAARQSLSGDDK